MQLATSSKIKNMQDQLIECPRCESPYCYQMIKEAYLESNCLYCGYTTSSQMVKDSGESKAILSKLPKFYQDVSFTDKDGFIWVPRYYRIEGKGELYANTTSAGEFIWTYAPHIKITTPEKELYKKADGTYIEYKADGNNAQHFKTDEYMLGLKALGVI